MSKTIKSLIKGYQEFQQHYFEGNNSVYRRLVRDGQQPTALIVACSDSRVDPALVLNFKRIANYFLIQHEYLTMRKEEPSYMQQYVKAKF